MVFTCFILDHVKIFTGRRLPSPQTWGEFVLYNLTSSWELFWDWKSYNNNCIFMNAHLKTKAECKNQEVKWLQLMKTREVYNKKHHYKARLFCLLSLEAKTLQSLCVFCIANLQCYKDSNYEANELVISLLSQQALVEESDLYLFSPSCLSYNSSAFVCQSENKIIQCYNSQERGKNKAINYIVN